MFKPPISKLYAKGCRTPFDLPERAALPSRGKRRSAGFGQAWFARGFHYLCRR